MNINQMAWGYIYLPDGKIEVHLHSDIPLAEADTPIETALADLKQDAGLGFSGDAERIAAIETAIREERIKGETWNY